MITSLTKAMASRNHFEVLRRPHPMANAGDPPAPAAPAAGGAALVVMVRRPSFDRHGPLAHWLTHLVEMAAAMLIGMEVLFGEFSAVANAFGYDHVMAQLPELSTVVMAITMTVPMALWMSYRGHPRRGIVEMSAAMALPAIPVLVAGTLGLVTAADLTSTYHLAMYVAMIGLMAVRWSEYAGGMSHEGAIS